MINKDYINLYVQNFIIINLFIGERKWNLQDNTRIMLGDWTAKARYKQPGAPTCKKFEVKE